MNLGFYTILAQLWEVICPSPTDTEFAFVCSISRIPHLPCVSLPVFRLPERQQGWEAGDRVPYEGDESWAGLRQPGEETRRSLLRATEECPVSARAGHSGPHCWAGGYRGAGSHWEAVGGDEGEAYTLSSLLCLPVHCFVRSCLTRGLHHCSKPQRNQTF